MAKHQSDFFLTPEEVRIVWPSVFEPSSTGPDDKVYDKPRYELTFFFPKKHQDPRQDLLYQFYARKIMEVFKAAHGHDRWEQVRTDPENSWPIRDGDKKHYVERNPWAAGHWHIKCWSLNPTRVVDARNNEISREAVRRMAEPPLKGGDYGLVSLNFWAYEFQGKHGVGGGLEGIKLLRPGEPVGGGGRTAAGIWGAPTGEPVYTYGSDVGPASGPVPSAPIESWTPPVGPVPPPVGYGAPPTPGYGAGGAAPGFVPGTAYGGPQPGYGPPPAPQPIYGTSGGPGGYGPPNGGLPPPPVAPTTTAPPPPPAPVVADPRAHWHRDPTGQWMLNPETRLWEPAGPPAPPVQSGYTPVQPPSSGPVMPPGYGPPR